MDRRFHLNLTPRDKPVVPLLALYAFERVREFVHLRHKGRPSLTSRQCEVLTWTAAGKTAWQIGEILHISKRTVDEHTRTAARNLGALNRTHAVVMAMREHLIKP